MTLTHVDAKDVPNSWIGQRVHITCTDEEMEGRPWDGPPEDRPLPTKTLYGGLADLGRVKGGVVLYIGGRICLVPPTRTVTRQIGELT